MTASTPAPGRPRRLDEWLSAPAVCTHHRCRAAAPPERLWTAAREVRLAETRTLGRLVRWRIPGVPEGQTFGGLLAEYPFVVLEEGAGWSLSGLCGRIWTLQRDYPRLEDAQAFREWDEPGTVRVLFAHWIEAEPDGGSAIVSEARVEPTDRAAEVRLRSLWLLVGVFERLIGAEPLALAAARAEGR